MSEISQQEFQRRRQALLAQMQPGSAALIFAAPEATRSADSEYPYRQSSDFWYFTGFNEPEAVLVLGLGMHSAPQTCIIDFRYGFCS